MNILRKSLSVIALITSFGVSCHASATAPGSLPKCIIQYLSKVSLSTYSRVILYKGDGTFQELSNTYSSTLKNGSSPAISGSYTYLLDPQDPTHATISYGGGVLPPDNLYFNSPTSGGQDRNNLVGLGTSGFIMYPMRADTGAVAFSTRCTLNGNGSITIGFVVAPGAPRWVLIRAVAGSLANFGVASSVTNPSFSLYNANEIAIGTSSVWSEDPNLVAGYKTVFSMVGEFPLNDGSDEGVMLVPLQPGVYTAIFRGNGEGQMLCEAFLLPY